MHMVELQQRLAAPGGLVVSGTGASRPIPARRSGKTLIAGFLYAWFPAPQGPAQVHIASPERLYFLNPTSGDLVNEERFSDGGRDLGPSGIPDGPALPEAERAANERVALEAMDRLFAAFADEKPLAGGLEKDAALYRAEFRRSVDPKLMPYYLRVGAPWFEWVGLK